MESVNALSDSIALLLTFVFIHFVPFVLAVMFVNRLQKKIHIFFGIVWALISFVPLGLFLYIIYFALTCGNGCFSGVFFLASLIMAVPLFLINTFIFFNLNNHIVVTDSTISQQINSAPFINPIFTPLQVFLGSFIGGCYTTIYLLARNYDSFGEQKYKNLIIIFGLILIFFIALLAIKTGIKIFSLVYIGFSLFAAFYTLMVLKRKNFPLSSFFLMSHSLDKRLTRTFGEWLKSVLLGWGALILTGAIIKFFE